MPLCLAHIPHDITFDLSLKCLAFAESYKAHLHLGLEKANSSSFEFSVAPTFRTTLRLSCTASQVPAGALGLRPFCPSGGLASTEPLPDQPGWGRGREPGGSWPYTEVRSNHHTSVAPGAEMGPWGAEPGRFPQSHGVCAPRAPLGVFDRCSYEARCWENVKGYYC